MIVMIEILKMKAITIHKPTCLYVCIFIIFVKDLYGYILNLFSWLRFDLENLRRVSVKVHPFPQTKDLK